MHFNDFSTNKNYNNSNNINIESNSTSTKKNLNSKMSSNISTKTKSKIDNMLNQNKIVKSSSMKILENVGNKYLFSILQ